VKRVFWSVLLLSVLLIGPVGCARDAATTDGASPTSPSGPVSTLVNVTDSINVTGGSVGTWNYAGQSVTIPGTGSFASARFNWYTFHGTPTAFGTLVVLDREFLGVPGDLGPSTPGYVGQADAVVEGNPGVLDDVKGEYVFPAAMTLRGGTRYWFYTNKPGSFVTSFDTDIYAGGDAYLTGYVLNPFRKAPASGRMIGVSTYVPPPAGVFVDANFKLQAAAR
jgi:hypothetical protein